VSLRRLWSTASLRLAMTLSLLFGLCAALLIAFFDIGVLRFAEAEAREDLAHQMAIMRDDATRRGGGALITMLEAQARNRESRRYLFLVLTPDGKSFSNGLRRDVVNAEGFRRNIGTTKRPARWPDQRPNMLVLSATMKDGTLLAIGRDTQHLDDLRTGMVRLAIWSGVGAIALALVAGLAAGVLVLRRLEAVNRSVGRVISGNASERLPAIGFGREFDELADNLNRMLDRQEATLDALKTMSEGIAHDLRTPLARLRNRLEEIDSDADDPDQRRARIALAQQEIDQITALFEALLALSRIESGKPAQPPAPLDVRALVGTVGGIYRPVVEDAGGTLHVEDGTGSDAPLMVRGDSNLLMQALSNLIENALVHGGARPAVTLGIARADGKVTLFVADRGSGIPRGEREKVVKRFYRMDRSRSRPGSGLGLAMCAAVADWHGGALILSDNEPGLIAELRLPAG